MRHVLVPTLLIVASLPFGAPAAAQVHHFPGGRPWSNQANGGPDAEVDGWLYQLGVTGIRVRLSDEDPTHLIVGHVFADSPADGKVEVGDHIVGAGGARFETPHRNGYGMDVFGPKGPIEDFAGALAGVLLGDDPKNRRRDFELLVLREEEERAVRIRLGKKASTFAPGFPFECEYTEEILPGLLETIAAAQRDDGSFGHPLHNTFAPLALLASGEKQYRDEVEKCVRFHARHTSEEDDASLVNWRYMAAAIVMSEWYLATGEKWVLPELREVEMFLRRGQYVSLDQVSERVKESHPDSYPTSPEQQHGGWGHNVGFEGYGPIAMLTGQGALSFALMERCGVEIDEERHRAAYAFLERGSGPNGYTWYADDVANPEGWADMGRTGAAALAFAQSPFEGHATLARRQAILMGNAPLSFPDTHGSPLMGMGYGAAAAFLDEPSFRRLMTANRWWFVLADCGDGTFHYQPNRDNAGYDGRARLAATAVTAFILTLPARSLALSGKVD